MYPQVLFLIIRDCFGLSFTSKGLGYFAALLLLLSLLARYKLSCYQTTQLLTSSTLAGITLLKTTCHFLVLLVRFDTLTYQKVLQLIPYTCGSSQLKNKLSGCASNLLATNYLAIKQLVTDNFSTCRHYLAEYRLSFPSAPHWVRHPYLSKGLQLISYTCGSSDNSMKQTYIYVVWSLYGLYHSSLCCQIKIDTVRIISI